MANLTGVHTGNAWASVFGTDNHQHTITHNVTSLYFSSLMVSTGGFYAPPGGVAVTNSTQFTIGTTVVTYTAVDAAQPGNSDSCEVSHSTIKPPSLGVSCCFRALFLAVAYTIITGRAVYIRLPP